MNIFNQKTFYLFHLFIVVLTTSLVYMDFFKLSDGILQTYTQESGFYELASGLFLFGFGLFLLLKNKQNFHTQVKYVIYFTGLVFILGALEELSWGQHLLGFESHEFFQEHNQQHEMNLHNFMPPTFFGLFINLSFYIFFMYIPIAVFFFKERLLNYKYSALLAYLPSVEITLIFSFGFALQKYFILDTYADTSALVIGLFLLSIVAYKKKELSFTLHLIALFFVSGFFMFAHEIFSFTNVQYEIREFIFIYGLIFWLAGVLKLLENSQEASKL